MAVAEIVARRAQQAGLDGVHPHLFRHTFAHDHLAAGGSEGALMQAGGWRSQAVMRRYGSSVAAERAREERKRLARGDRV